MIESILTFIAVGTFWFWLLIAIASGIVIGCLEDDKIGWPIFLTILFSFIYYEDLALVFSDWRVIGIFLFIYVVCGVIWSFYRWFIHVRKFIKNYNRKEFSPLKDSRELNVSYNKSLITGWIIYWPWSLVWNLTGDFFRNLFEGLKKSYQKIVDKQLEELK
jgi:hypothetical protein